MLAVCPTCSIGFSTSPIAIAFCQRCIYNKLACFEIPMCASDKLLPRQEKWYMQIYTYICTSGRPQWGEWHIKWKRCFSLKRLNRSTTSTTTMTTTTFRSICCHTERACQVNMRTMRLPPSVECCHTERAYSPCVLCRMLPHIVSTGQWQPSGSLGYTESRVATSCRDHLIPCSPLHIRPPFSSGISWHMWCQMRVREENMLPHCMVDKRERTWLLKLFGRVVGACPVAK